MQALQILQLLVRYLALTSVSAAPTCAILACHPAEAEPLAALAAEANAITKFFADALQVDTFEGLSDALESFKTIRLLAYLGHGDAQWKDPATGTYVNTLGLADADGALALLNPVVIAAHLGSFTPPNEGAEDGVGGKSSFKQSVKARRSVKSADIESPS